MENAQNFPVSDEPLKVFIRDVHLLEQDLTDPNFYFFRNRKIRKVDIMGVVTEVRNLHDAQLYRGNLTRYYPERQHTFF